MFCFSWERLLMPRDISLAFSLLLLFSFISFTPLWGQGKKVRWPKINGAGGYIAEIKNPETNEIVERAKLTVPEYAVNVPDGDYLFRVGALNKFGKNPVFSRWTPLKVRIARLPEVDPAGKVIQDENSKEGFIVRGQDFSSQVNAFLTRDSKKYALKIIGQPKQDQLNFAPPDIPPGTYDLHVVNPLEKTKVIPNFITITGKARINRWQVLWRSSLLPGWGQFYAGNMIQGYTVAGLMVTAIGFYIYSDISYLKAQDDYSKLKGDINDANFRNELFSAKDDLGTATKVQNTAFFILIGAYVINLVDAAFFNGPYGSNPTNQNSTVATSFGFWGNEAFASVHYKF